VARKLLIQPTNLTGIRSEPFRAGPANLRLLGGGLVGVLGGPAAPLVEGAVQLSCTKLRREMNWLVHPATIGWPSGVKNGNSSLE
jgi:hypothetical protein